MKEGKNKRIHARLSPEDFVGRQAELDHLRSYAMAAGPVDGLSLLAAPSAGSSELARQFADRLFIEQDLLIPFYFRIKSSDGSAHNASLRFLRDFLAQTVAFRRRDSGIIAASPGIREIAELAPPADGYWVDRLADTYENFSEQDKGRPTFGDCLSAPIRAAIHGARSIVIIDDLHIAPTLTDGNAFLDDIIDTFSRSMIHVVFVGHRRFLFGRSAFRTMPVDRLSFDDTGELITRMAGNAGVDINDQTRDLLAVQLGSNVHHIESHFAAARSESVSFDTFQNVESVYTEEIFGGQTGKYYDSVINRVVADIEDQKQLVRLLAEALKAGADGVSTDYCKKRLSLSDTAFVSFLENLHCLEVANVSSGLIRVDVDDLPLCDYIDSRFRLDVSRENRALSVGNALSAYARRAPQIMARFYRRASIIGLRELMRAFDGRSVSSALIDHNRFRSDFRGGDPVQLRNALAADTQTTILPRIIYTAHTAALYPSFGELCDRERSTVAMGFAGSGNEVETVWLAAEIDSKLEATSELTDFWCDRLEMAAVNCGFTDYRIWLIAPEGFSAEATEALIRRNALGSSREQAQLLAEVLDVAVPNKNAETAGDEYEFVLPMTENAELIAVNTFEEIAHRYSFPAKPTNQIKTALLEACINAEEHSLSPDRRITLKFIVDPDKVFIVVTNRGVRLNDKKINGDPAGEARRGWGLKIIQGLMDDVHIENTDDGTQLTMIKNVR